MIFSWKMALKYSKGFHTKIGRSYIPAVFSDIFAESFWFFKSRSQYGGERCSSGVLMRKAFHKPCALTPCAHSGAGGVAFMATSLGPPAGVTAKHISFQIKQTSLWKIHFRAMSLNFIFNARVPIFFMSNVSENQFQNFQLARCFALFCFSDFIFSCVDFILFLRIY